VKVQIITNLDNGAGLQQDYALLSGILQELGHSVNPVHIHRPANTMAAADLNIFLEVLVPGVMSYAQRNWIVPNSEWWGRHWDVHLPKIDRVLVKTRDAESIWQAKTPGKTTYVGWAANDYHDPTTRKELKFLHTAGKSLTKNTAAVMEAWSRYKLPYPLTVSAFKPEIARLCRGVPNVRLVSRFTHEELVGELNSSQFFLMPSKYEGYGHSIHEALGCRAVVLTTAGEPMQSFSGIPKCLLIPVERTDKMAEARASFVTAKGIRDVVANAANTSPHVLEFMGDKAREGFLQDNDFFHTEIRSLFNGL
jgi:glycosyltransferase involved in cell wall biosynthesis